MNRPTASKPPRASPNVLPKVNVKSPRSNVVTQDWWRYGTPGSQPVESGLWKVDQYSAFPEYTAAPIASDPNVFKMPSVDVMVSVSLRPNDEMQSSRA